MTVAEARQNFAKSFAGLSDLLLWKMKVVLPHDGSKALAVNRRDGAQTEHSLKFINNVVVVLDAQNMTGRRSAMDSARWHPHQ